MKYAFLIITIIGVIACKSPKQDLKAKIESAEQIVGRDSMLTDQKSINDLLVLYKTYYDKYSDDTLSASYMYRAAEFNQRTRRAPEALVLYKRYYTTYGTTAKAPTSLFLQAFLYETEIQNKDSAKIVYRQFLEKYPTHALAPSAKATLDQLELGLSDEDLVKMFEARIDSANSAGN